VKRHKITEALSPRDPGRRVNYCNSFIQSVNAGIFVPKLVLSVSKCG
jgi:hypothetical protein